MLTSGGHPGARRARQRGMSMIEVLIVMAVTVLLMVAGVPAIGTWSADARVRSTAEALQNSLRKAQLMAIERSRTVVVGMTAGTPAYDATISNDGGNWMVLVMPLTGSDEALADDSLVAQYDETRRAGVSIDGPAALCFNSLGQQSTRTSSELDLDAGCTAPTDANPTVYTLTHPGGSRTLQVQVSLGGRVRMCDAEKTLSEDHPDGC